MLVLEHKVACLIFLKGLIVAIVVMITRLKLQRGEGKLLIASPEIRTRRKKIEKASSSPNGPLKSAHESPQDPSPSIEIEEVQIAQEDKVIEEVQSIQIYEPQSIAIMSREREPKAPSPEEEEIKKYLYT